MPTPFFFFFCLSTDIFNSRVSKSPTGSIHNFLGDKKFSRPQSIQPTTQLANHQPPPRENSILSADQPIAVNKVSATSGIRGDFNVSAHIFNKILFFFCLSSFNKQAFILNDGFSDVMLKKRASAAAAAAAASSAPVRRLNTEIRGWVLHLRLTVTPV